MFLILILFFYEMALAGLSASLLNQRLFFLLSDFTPVSGQVSLSLPAFAQEAVPCLLASSDPTWWPNLPSLPLFSLTTSSFVFLSSPSHRGVCWEQKGDSLLSAFLMSLEHGGGGGG